MARQIKNLTELPVMSIEAWEDERRMRNVTQAGCEPLLASIEELGVMKDPIQVRRIKGEPVRYELMAGGHRLAVAKMLGWEMIPVSVWECSDTWAQLVEVDDNLARRDLSALDTAVFLKLRKEVYEAAHPEVASDAFKGNRYTGPLAPAAPSFTRMTAEKFGVTPRTIQRMLQAGAKLTDGEVQKLQAAAMPISGADLIALGKIDDLKKRAAVVDSFKDENHATLGDAIRAESSAETKEKLNPDEASLKALQKAFGAASKKARRNFVEDNQEDLIALLGLSE